MEPSGDIINVNNARNGSGSVRPKPKSVFEINSSSDCWFDLNLTLTRIPISGSRPENIHLNQVGFG